MSGLSVVFDPGFATIFRCLHNKGSLINPGYANFDSCDHEYEVATC